jgi:hypothetical protein
MTPRFFRWKRIRIPYGNSILRACANNEDRAGKSISESEAAEIEEMEKAENGKGRKSDHDTEQGVARFSHLAFHEHGLSTRGSQMITRKVQKNRTWPRAV